jgi:hypothetical protein
VTASLREGLEETLTVLKLASWGPESGASREKIRSALGRRRPGGFIRKPAMFHAEGVGDYL